jgi:hypothetical protein
MQTINQHIGNTALKYLGQTELKNNSGFKDKQLEKRMSEVGWKMGESWCAYFAELVWKEAYDSYEMKNDISKELLDKLFSGSSTQTHKNFDQSNFITRNQTNKNLLQKVPVPGALAIWRYGNDWTGHTGIVLEPIGNAAFISIEGNTNDDGAREGYEVAKRIRKLNAPFSENGLNLIGFIYPLQP